MTPSHVRYQAALRPDVILFNERHVRYPSADGLRYAPIFAVVLIVGILLSTAKSKTVNAPEYPEYPSTHDADRPLPPVARQIQVLAASGDLNPGFPP
jgi:hypothetical protein